MIKYGITQIKDIWIFCHFFWPEEFQTTLIFSPQLLTLWQSRCLEHKGKQDQEQQQKDYLNRNDVLFYFDPSIANKTSQLDVLKPI